MLRHLPWILAVGFVVIACGPDNWKKQPLVVCDEGSPNCGTSENKATPKPTKSSENKGPDGLPESSPEGKNEQEEETTTPNEEEEEEQTPADPKDAGGNTTPPKDAGPPPKGPTCLSNANTCIAVAEKCGCPEDCCAGTVCAQVGGLVQNTCCKQASLPCLTHSDCCGQLLCKPNGTTGGNTCQ